MAGAAVFSDDLPPERTADFDSGLSVPPFDTAFFSQQFIDDEGAIGDSHNDVVAEDFDFDFSFDDLYMPTAEELDDLLNPTQVPEFGSQPACDADCAQFPPDGDRFDAVFKSTCSELRHASGDAELSDDHSSGFLSSVSSGLESHQVSGYLNVPSPESNGSNRRTSKDGGGELKASDCPSPESRGSGNCASNVSEQSNDLTKSVSSSPYSNSGSTRVNVVNHKIKSEEPLRNNVSASVLKRKKDCEYLPNNNFEPRINKHRKSNCDSENNNNNANGAVSEEEKRKARLVRNRESAQLSRQRKKHYVDELEEKVKVMNSTIQELNAKVMHFMAENATLRQQMGAGGAVPPQPMALPPPGVYPHPAMMYPWMPYAPPYMVKPQGSQVPLVPIPRLKPQQTSQAPKGSKKAEGKNNERSKTKKVAGISFLGLLFFIMLFGGLAPMIKMRYGGVRGIMTGEVSYVGSGFYEKHHGGVLMVNGSVADGTHGNNSSLHCGHDSSGKPNVNGFVRLCNESEPLVASLYVPRNDKLVKIDGNLIIHSVLASEKALSSDKYSGGETGLAVPGGLVPANHVPGVRRNGARLPQLPALGSSSVNMDGRKASDSRIQQWFREGLSGPMLSSGMCTEVFQFDVSPPSASGAIFAATTTRNISEEQNHNSTHLTKGRNRRILRGLPIPLPESSHNISRPHKGRTSQKENSKGNNTVSPMVVSVLVDPRDGGDADVDGVMGKKSLSRIFVVVLIDSVKHVTYSCMLPFKGSALHLVAA